MGEKRKSVLVPEYLQKRGCHVRFDLGELQKRYLGLK